MDKPKVLWCWTRISGYMSAAWQALSSNHQVELRILAWAGADEEVAFNESLVQGLDCVLLSKDECNSKAELPVKLREFQPDVLVVPGWLHGPYRSLAIEASRRGATVFMGMDTPWRGKPKQYLTQFAFGKFLRAVDQVVVAGERTWQYARHIGFDERQIHRGVYCYDERIFNCPTATAWNRPNGFIFVGRLVPEKGLDVLVRAYSLYRSSVENPWDVTIVGRGKLQGLVANVPGMRLTGFIDPVELPSLYQQHRVALLPSIYEPWGVALAEAMGCGLPVIASEACGAGIDLIRAYTNGIAVATDSAQELARAMVWMHQNEAILPEMGKAAKLAVQPFGATQWAKRWSEWFQGAIAEKRDGKR